MIEPSEKIPVLDLHPEVEMLWDELNRAIQGVLRSTTFILGPNERAFESEAAAYLGARHAIGVNSGTDALVIGLRAAGVGPGDEVITTGFTFFATAEAISSVGATPVFVDVRPQTYNIDPAQVEAAITPKTKAILPVHLFGQAAEMGPLLEIAKRRGLLIVEDVAQAFGGTYQDKKLGTLGDVGCFSFFPTKNLGAYGDGGLIVTNNDAIAEQAQMLRAHGSKQKYHNEMLGYNSRLDEIQAAILRVKLPHLDAFNEARRRVAQRYNEQLANLPSLETPGCIEEATPVYHQYTVRITNGRRDAVRSALADAGIATMIYYPVPVHRLPVYASNSPHLPVAEQLAEEVLSLPIWPQMEVPTQDRVLGALRTALQQ